MEKESGVYLTITDESFETGGTSSLKVIVPMLTNKGKLGMNYVTAADYKNIVGYDLEYNSNYYGLAKILEKVSYAYVWRLNQGAKLSNAYFLSTTSEKESSEDAETFEDITKLDPAPILAYANKTVGNTGDNFVKLTPTPLTSTVVNENATASMPQTIEIEDVSQTEEIDYQGKTIKSGCMIYNSTNNVLVAVIKPNNEGQLSVYKVVDGEIVDDVITIDKFNIWTDGTNFYDGDLNISTEPVGEPGEPVALGDVRNTTYDVTQNVWEIDGVSYDEDENVITPEGTKNTGTTICEVYIPDGTEEHINPSSWYATNDVGTRFYTITKLADTWENSTIIEVTDTDAISTLSDLYTNSKFTELKYFIYTTQVHTGMYRNIANSWYKVLSFTTTMIVTQSTSETNETIINALDGAADIPISLIVYTHEYISKINTIGTAEWNENNLTVVLINKPSADSYFTIRHIPVEIEDWTLTYANYKDNQYAVKNTVDFSTNSESEIYWKEVNFGDLDIFINGRIASNWAAIRDYIQLENGSNGYNDIVASEIDLTPLETSPCNVLAMNGITSYKVANKIASKAADYFIHCFVDTPAYKSYMDTEMWVKNVFQNEYVAIGSRPDVVEIDEKGNTIFVYPSVNYVHILANMLKYYGSLCYPPAGLTYGGISVEQLLECDYENYGNELKTNRINWQRTLNNGTVMWEQRTTYPLRTDLSYIAPVFIVDEIRDQIIPFEQQFNFRYMTPTDLLNQESGLTNIFEDLKTKGFIYSYDIRVPSYADAQKAGRILEIPISVAITKDSEVIEMRVRLVNAS